MKRIIALLGLLLPLVTFGQGYITVPDFRIYNQTSIGKGDLTATDASAWLEIGKPGTNRGFLLPRVNNIADIANPKKGLLVFQQSNNTMQVHDGTQWNVVATAVGATPNLQNVTDAGQTSTNPITVAGVTLSVVAPAGAGSTDVLTMNTGGAGSTDNTKIRYKMRLVAGESSTFGGSNLELVAYDNSGNTTKIPFSYNRNLGQWVFSDEVYIGSVAADNKVVTFGQRNTATWNADRLNGQDISTVAPADGQMLAFNESSGEWEPTTPAAAGVTSVNGQTGDVIMGIDEVLQAGDTAYRPMYVNGSSFSGYGINMNRPLDAGAGTIGISMSYGTGATQQGAITVNNTQTQLRMNNSIESVINLNGQNSTLNLGGAFGTINFSGNTENILNMSSLSDHYLDLGTTGLKIRDAGDNITGQLFQDGRHQGAAATNANEFVTRQQVTDSLAARNAGVVHIAGTESIQGAKTFNLSVLSGGIFESTNGTIRSFQGISGGVAGSMGTFTNHPFQIYTNNSLRGTITATGRFLLGSAVDDGSTRVQINGNASGDAATAANHFVTRQQMTDSLDARESEPVVPGWAATTSVDSHTDNAITISGLDGYDTITRRGLQMMFVDSATAPESNGIAYIRAGKGGAWPMTDYSGLSIGAKVLNLGAQEATIIGSYGAASYIEMAHNNQPGELFITTDGPTGQIYMQALTGPVHIGAAQSLELQGINSVFHADEKALIVAPNQPARVVQSYSIGDDTYGLFQRLQIDRGITEDDAVTKYQLDSVAALIGGGGGSTFYDSDGSFTGPRTVDAASNNLTFTNLPTFTQRNSGVAFLQVGTDESNGEMGIVNIDSSPGIIGATQGQKMFDISTGQSQISMREDSIEFNRKLRVIGTAAGLPAAQDDQFITRGQMTDSLNSREEETLIFNVRSTAVNTSFTTTDYMIVITTDGVTVTLPSAAAFPGRKFVLKIGFGTSGQGGTLESTGGELIDGATTVSLINGPSQQFRYTAVISDGTQWWKESFF